MGEEKKKYKTVIVSAIASLAVFAAFAETYTTYTWTGKYSDVWDLTEKNWTNENGEEVAYVNYSNAVFDDTAESFTVRFTNNAVRAGDILFNAENVYTVTNNGSKGYLYYATSIRKTGSGTLLFRPASSLLLNELSTGFFSDGGEVEFSGQSSLNKFSYKSENVFSVTNTILRFATRNIFSSDITKPLTAPVIVKNGRFIASDPNGHLMIGPLTLDNSTFDYSGLLGYNGYGIMTFSGKLTFKGTTPYALLQESMTTPTKETLKHISLWSDPKTEFCVDDITDNPAEDVTVGTKLSDHCYASSSVQKIPLYKPGGLLKTGTGTLALTNAQNIFCGDIEVREGMLQVGPNWQLNANSQVADPKCHWLGCLTNENRKIIVKEGAWLYFPNRNCFGTQKGITNLCKDINVTLVFDGGTFTNIAGQGFLLPNVEFSNGGSIAPGYGPSNYGRFMVKECFTVRGSVPFEWNLSDAAFGDAEQMGREALSLNGYPENVFDIADVTDDSMVDATFGIPFIIGHGYFRNDTDDGNHRVDDWKFGFRKTGLGTMRITAPRHVKKHDSTLSGYNSLSFNGDPKVLEGTLQVDGNLSLSDTVRVYEGAYLSGTGLVNNVSIAQGGGLRVRDGQTDTLRIGGDLSVEVGLKIDVLLADGADVRDVKANVLTVSGEIEGAESLVSASVFVDGVSVPNIKLRLDDGALSLRYMRGTTVVLR